MSFDLDQLELHLLPADEGQLFLQHSSRPLGTHAFQVSPEMCRMRFESSLGTGKKDGVTREPGSIVTSERAAKVVLSRILCKRFFAVIC